MRLPCNTSIFQKKMSFENITAEEIQYVEDKLNNRPKKKFGYQTPNEVFLQKLKTTGQVAFITWIRLF
jgi:transposase, IS30 family